MTCALRDIDVKYNMETEARWGLAVIFFQRNALCVHLWVSPECLIQHHEA